MESIVLRLQKNFLLKKFYKSMAMNSRLFYLLDSYTSSEQIDKKFCELQRILVNSQHLKHIAELINTLYRYYKIDDKVAPKINARKFLIAWLMVSFPEFTIGIKRPGINKEEYPIDIYFICQDLISYTYQLLTKKTSEDLRKFKKAFNKYSNAINYFLARDKHEHVRKLINEFIDIDKTIDEISKSTKYNQEEKDSSIAVISKTKSKIAIHLKKIDSTIELSYLETISKIYYSVEDNMEKVMIDILIKDIETKKLNYLEKLLSEIRIKVGNFDNTIIQQIGYGSLTYDQVLNFGDQLVFMTDNNEKIDLWNDVKSQSYVSNELLARLIVILLRE